MVLFAKWVFYSEFQKVELEIATILYSCNNYHGKILSITSPLIGLIMGRF